MKDEKIFANRNTDEEKTTIPCFSLKRMMALIGLLALILAFYINFEEARQNVASIRSAGAEVDYFEIDESSIGLLKRCLRNLFPRAYFDDVRVVYFWNRAVSDKELAGLTKFRSVEELWLGRTRVTDEGLAFLSHIKTLKTLDLTDTQITDAGLKYLSDINSLEGLYLNGTDVTDEGLIHLSNLKSLKLLWLPDDQVGEEAISGLKKTIPNCVVIH